MIRFWRWELGSVVAVLLALFPVIAAAQQSASVEVTIDSPSGITTISNGQTMDIGGWAVDPASTAGTGVDQVVLSIDGPITSSSWQIPMTYGTVRPDVARTFGRADWTTAGFNLSWTAQGLSDGQHTLYVNAHSARAGWSSNSVVIAAVAAPPLAVAPEPQVVAPPAPLVSVQPPPVEAALPPGPPVEPVIPLPRSCEPVNLAVMGLNGPISTNGLPLCTP